MKTTTKFGYAIFTSIVLAIGALSADAMAGGLFASVNGTTGQNGAGFIYQFSPNGLQRIVASGLSRPRGIAFNRLGNLFVANTTCDTQTCQASIAKITPGGGQSTVATLSGDLVGEEITFDPAGNLFVIAVDQDDPNLASTIYKITPGGVQIAFGNVPSQGFGLAFDSAGNLFAASDDPDVPTIYKFTPDGTRTVFVHPSATPTGLAFDRFGNLFGSAGINILEFTPDGVESTFATSLNSPRGLAFDRNGNLFVAEIPSDTAGDILKFTPNGIRTVVAVLPGEGNSGPEFLTFQR